MGDIIKVVALLCAWYNRREGLAAQFAMQPEDWTIVSYDEGLYGSFSATVTNRLIGDQYFLVLHDGLEKKTDLSQYRMVATEMISDVDLILPTVGQG